MTRLLKSLITHDIDSGAPLEMLKTWHSKKTHLVRVRVRVRVRVSGTRRRT